MIEVISLEKLLQQKCDDLSKKTRDMKPYERLTFKNTYDKFETINNIEGGTKKFISDVVSGKVALSDTNLISASRHPIEMFQVLVNKISNLTKGRQKKVFENIDNFINNKQADAGEQFLRNLFVTKMKEINEQLQKPKSFIQQETVKESMNKLIALAKKNKFNLKQLI